MELVKMNELRIGVLDYHLLLDSSRHAESELHRKLFTALLAVRNQLVHILLHFNVEPEDAEDVLQSALLVTLRDLDKIRDFKGFVVALTWRKCLQHKQKTRNRSAKEVVWDGEVAGTSGQASVFSEGVESRIDVGRFLQELPASQRDSIWLWSCGYSSSEIAVVLGLSEGSIRKIRSRGEKRLKAMMR